jgi:hypothetical protein
MLPFETAWNFEDMMLDEVSQTQKRQILHDLTYLHELLCITRVMSIHCYHKNS